MGGTTTLHGWWMKATLIRCFGEFIVNLAPHSGLSQRILFLSAVSDPSIHRKIRLPLALRAIAKGGPHESYILFIHAKFFP